MFPLIACEHGRYGVNCSQPCEGHCRGGATCNHVTGLCDRGCDAGWTGFKCDKGSHVVFMVFPYAFF